MRKAAGDDETRDLARLAGFVFGGWMGLIQSAGGITTSSVTPLKRPYEIDFEIDELGNLC